jgi:hypothetical protein
MEGEATAEGAVAKVSHVRYSLPRSYAWVRTAEIKDFLKKYLVFYRKKIIIVGVNIYVNIT